MDTEPFLGGSYQYETLQGFRPVRFIELQPRHHALPATVHINLIHASIEDKTSYYALSYVWGTLDQPEIVICNGQSLPVTANLLTALTAIRETFCSENPLRLWVDAICINQSDNEEKKWQVQRMRSIYRGAEKVIDCLARRRNK
jgi:hypothetical protein